MKYIVVILASCLSLNLYAAKSTDTFKVTRLDWAVLQLQIEGATEEPKIEYLISSTDTIQADIDFTIDKKDPKSKRMAKSLERVAKSNIKLALADAKISNKIKIVIRWDGLALPKDEADRKEAVELNYHLRKKQQVRD